MSSQSDDAYDEIVQMNYQPGKYESLSNAPDSQTPTPQKAPPTPPKAPPTKHKPVRRAHSMQVQNDMLSISLQRHLTSGHPTQMPPPVPTKPRPSLPTQLSFGMSLPRAKKPPPPLPHSHSDEHIVQHDTSKPLQVQDVRPIIQRTEVLSEAMSLEELVSRYTDKFPLRMRIVKGFCGSTLRTTIATTETYDVHFVKKTKVIIVKDTAHTQYSIPLNSAIEFGLVFNPENKLNRATEGYTYRKVVDIIALSTMPKVIYSQLAIRGNDDKSTVFAKEILIIKGVHKPKHRGKRSLKVFSMMSRSEKILPEGYCGQFSTQPFLVKLHLSDIMEYLPDPFPADALMSVDYDLFCKRTAELRDIPVNIFTQNKIVKLCSCKVETSLVSTIDDSNSSSRVICDEKVIFDIPITEELDEIEVAVVEAENVDDVERLYTKTNDIFESFNPSKVLSCKDASTETSYSTQSFMYKAVRPGCEKVGVNIVEPSSIYDVPTACLQRLQQQQETKAKEAHNRTPQLPPRSEHTKLTTTLSSPANTLPCEEESEYDSVLGLQEQQERRMQEIPQVPPRSECRPTKLTNETAHPPSAKSAQQQFLLPSEDDNNYDTVLGPQEQEKRKPGRVPPQAPPRSEHTKLMKPRINPRLVQPTLPSQDEPENDYDTVLDVQRKSVEVQRTEKKLHEENSKQILEMQKAIEDLKSSQAHIASRVSDLESHIKRLSSAKFPEAIRDTNTAQSKEANQNNLSSLDVLQVRSFNAFCKFSTVI